MDGRVLCVARLNRGNPLGRELDLVGDVLLRDELVAHVTSDDRSEADVREELLHERVAAQVRIGPELELSAEELGVDVVLERRVALPDLVEHTVGVAAVRQRAVGATLLDDELELARHVAGQAVRLLGAELVEQSVIFEGGGSRNRHRRRDDA